MGKLGRQRYAEGGGVIKRARGGRAEDEERNRMTKASRPDEVGGPASDMELEEMDRANYEVGKRVRPHYERKDDF